MYCIFLTNFGCPSGVANGSLLPLFMAYGSDFGFF